MTMEAQISCFDPALVALLWEIKGVQKTTKEFKSYSRKLLIFPKEIKKCKFLDTRARERHGAARRGRRSPSRSHAGIDPRTGSGPMGSHPAQSRGNGPKARNMLTAGLAANAAGFPETDLKPRRCLMEAGEHVVT
jgi:hypothetical protein